VREAAIPVRRSLARTTASVLLGWNTLGALRRLTDKKLLSTEDRDALTAAYLFLRDVEHKLQMVDDLQTHSLPESSEELERCAVRMGYGAEDRTSALKRFSIDHARHTKVVHDQFLLFFSQPESSLIFHAVFRLMR
jgi:[glutamine synthetase] adenylyltransferase / [glutamine synthetase]-adenylyl-L-tyrosine phosphorylase